MMTHKRVILGCAVAEQRIKLNMDNVRDVVRTEVVAKFRCDRCLQKLSRIKNGAGRRWA